MNGPAREEGHKEPRYWFPAKRYGWGWGLPATREGWIVFAAYFAVLITAGVWLSTDPSPGRVLAFLALTLMASGALVVICWRKGEPPRWRWGGD